MLAVAAKLTAFSGLRGVWLGRSAPRPCALLAHACTRALSDSALLGGGASIMDLCSCRRACRRPVTHTHTPGHFLMECPYYNQHRQHLFSELTRIAPQQQMLLAQVPVDEAAWKLVSEHFWNAGRVGGRTRPILGGEDDDRPRWVEAFSHIAEFVANAWYARCALMSNNQPLAAPSASPAPAGGGGAVGAEAHGRDASCGV